MPPQEVDGEDSAMAGLMLGTVRAAMQSLPEEQRIVVLLVCVEQFSYAQVAEMLAVPVGTVMSPTSQGPPGAGSPAPGADYATQYAQYYGGQDPYAAYGGYAA